MLKQRMIFGVLGIILMLGIIIFCPEVVISSCVALIAFIGLYEFHKVTGLKNNPVIIVSYLFSIAAFSMILFRGKWLQNQLLLLLSAYIFVLMISAVLCHSRVSFKNAAISFMGTSYITLFFLHIIFIRKASLGNFNIWLIFISAWATDTFAYFAGRCLGKHKLCPTISPKKTVEGAIGGVVGCVICIVLYVYFCARCSGLNVNYCSAIVFSALVSVFSQLGDLAASCIKREYGVKDYGNLIPGHGGILDRFDSALLIAPFVYYFITFFPVIF